MHLSLLATFVILLAFPSIATAVFWLSSVSRRYRTARWLLAPCIYLGVVAFQIIVGVNLGWFADNKRSPAQYAVTMEDWKNHPDVNEVRVIYDEIKNGIRANIYRTKIRRFNVESASCSTYPIKSEMLVLDSQNRPRLYQIEQIGSDRESFTVERYYDVKGTLRFVYVDRVITNSRIYLNGAGNVVWAVEQHENKFTVFESDKEDWEMNPNTANKAKEEFQEQRLCPEITKQSTAQPGSPGRIAFVPHRT